MEGNPMLGSLKAIIFCTLSGLSASALGGVVAVFLLLVGGNGLDRAIPSAVLAAFLGAVYGITFAAIPTILAGALLWFANKFERRIDRTVTWIAVGIIVGLMVRILYGPATVTPIRDGYSRGLSSSGVSVCFATAGAVAAIMFRQTMRALTGFLPSDDSL
jgi:hypothetical protein